jgi:hypothetical protein
MGGRLVCMDLAFILKFGHEYAPEARRADRGCKFFGQGTVGSDIDGNPHIHGQQMAFIAPCRRGRMQGPEPFSWYT